MSYPVLHIANKIIANTNVEEGELISNLKLQKLLYYVQGFNLAIFDKPLFDEDIEAWMYGPVVASVYQNFNKFGSTAITIDKTDSIASLSPEEEELFREVLLEYGQFSAIKLMNMTHEETPWRVTFYEQPKSVISNDLISDYFKTYLVE